MRIGYTEICAFFLFLLFFFFLLISQYQDDVSATPPRKTLLSRSQELRVFSFFFCLFFPRRRQQHLRRIRPDRACCSAFRLQTLEDCLVQTEFVWFFEAAQSCSGESERLQLFGTSPGSEASSTPAWHLTHSSTLRPLFCSAASGSQSNQTDEQSWTQCTSTKRHHTVPLNQTAAARFPISLFPTCWGLKKLK